MELRDYMSIRRAYNIVRQETESAKRLTFEEFAILCRLDLARVPIKTSDIAAYQGALRPTMTHRTNRLASLGLIDREGGSNDRRIIVCSISEEGHRHVMNLANRTRHQIVSGHPLERTSPERVRHYVNAMGSIYCTAGELVMLALVDCENNEATITDLVRILGFLQPTVSMSVSALVKDGLLKRVAQQSPNSRASIVTLTDAGRAVADEISALISAIVVSRHFRIENAPKVMGPRRSGARGRAGAQAKAVAESKEPEGDESAAEVAIEQVLSGESMEE